jgi:glycine/D-amino acid oxidase-like deaminating enzyme
MAIAILGGGILGGCTALELADRGHHVVLFERNAELLSEASLHNEGKLHLGFVYAADPTFRTAERMIRGAVRFMDVLERWIPSVQLHGMVARPFDYLVHRDSMITVPQVEHHFAMVSAALEEHVSPSVRHAPVHPDRPSFRRLSDAELSTRYDPSLIAAAFETSEIAIDPWAVATALRRALRAHPRIELRMSTRVIRVHERNDRSFDVLCENDEAPRIGPFDGVVNALWTNRHAIDQRSGIATGPTSFTRRKLGVSLLLREMPATMPSVTVMLGPFGDTVCYQSGRVYLSWYPDCMIGVTTRIEETDWTRVLEAVDHEWVRARTLEALGALCPPVRELARMTDVDVVVNGGSIFALAVSDIDDPASGLHERIDRGATERDRYLSVDTAKYTLAPALAVETAQRMTTLIGVTAAR